MPPRPAKGSAAQSFVAARGAPDSLQSFLGGMSLPSQGGAEDAAMMEVNLKLLQKSNETTVLKALVELNRQVGVVEETELLSYLPSIIEAVLRHADHANATVRAGIFSLLHGMLRRGEAVRGVLEQELPSLIVVWVARMNDMETSVRKDARDAFSAAFHVHVLQKYADTIVEGLIETFKDMIEHSRGKPLQGDNLDRRSNTLYSSVCALGYMMRQPVTARQKIIAFVQKQSLQPIMPLREGATKGSLVAKAPVVRSASLSLLRNIVESRLMTPEVHRCVATALHDAMFESEVVVLQRAWELLLLWCGEDAGSAIEYFHDGFLADVIGSFVRCSDAAAAEVIYPSLVPLLVPLTRDPRCADVAGEFGDALVEKLSHLGVVGVQEWRLVLSAMLQTWELLCVRTAGSGGERAQNGPRLFHHIIAALALAMEAASNRARYFPTSIAVATQSITRASRHGECFRECMHILCGHPDAHFHVLPSGGSAALAESFNILQAALVGTSVALPGMSEEAERLLTKYTDDKLWEPLTELLRASAAKKEGNNNGDTAVFTPEKSVRLKVARGIIEAIRCNACEEEEEDDGEAKERQGKCLKEIFSLLLLWKDSEVHEELRGLSVGGLCGLEWVQESIRAHEMRDPEQMMRVFVKVCEEAEFDTVEHCLNLTEAKQQSLTTAEKEQLRHAVQESLEATLRLVADCGNSSSEEEAAAGGSVTPSDEDLESAGNDSNSKIENDNDGSSNDSSEEDTDNGSDEEEDEDAANEGAVVLQRLLKWVELLRKGGRLAVLLDFNGEHLMLPTLFRIVAAVAPRLHAEQYMSIKALRVALQEDGDPLLHAMAQKKHHLGVGQFNQLVERLEQLLDSYGISVEQRDTCSLELFDTVMRDPSCALAACGQLSRLVPFASGSLLQGIACSSGLWADHQVRPRDTDPSCEGEVPFAMLDRYCALDAMELSMLRCVRTAQLVHLLGASVPIETCDAVVVTLPLLRAARVQEALADPIRKLLTTRLLPRALLRLTSPEDVLTLLAGGAEPHLLVCTLAGVLRDVAATAGDALIATARRIAGVVTQWITDTLLLREGTAPVHAAAVAAYRAFFASLDEVADIVGNSIPSTVGARQAAALQEAMCMLPTLDARTALLTMTLHRHLSSAPVVVASTVQQVVAHALNQRPLDGVELLAELASSRIIDTTAYNTLVHTITHLLSRCCRLRHMPPNGRLVSQAANDPPMSSRELRRVVVSAVSARRGVILHGRMDDVLRSSVNLILFDAVTECVVSLRHTREEEVPLLAKLIAFTSSCLSELAPADVAVLRSSEVSVTKVAGVINFAYQWLCATPIAKLENIGMVTVATAIDAVALLSNLTLMRSSFVLLPIMRQITSKRMLKNLRSEFGGGSLAKVNLFMRHAGVIAKTKKQRLALFPHLLAWCVTLSGPVQENFTKERREEVFHLLDLLCSLLLTSAVPGTKRIDDTYLCSSAKRGGENLGFETAALTRAGDVEPMRELAKGAAAVFALLLQSNTLSFVKSWLDTIERKLQDLFYTFVDDHISPILIQESLFTVLGKSPSGGSTFEVNENYNVTVSLPNKLIKLKYTMEDASVTVQIAFPSAFPLRLPTVTYESGRDCGVSTDKWRSWMLKMTVLLFGGSANVWECVTLFGRNMDAHFSGQEPCPICFAVVSAVSHRLPDMRCAVCRNSALHSDCLYAWWTNSGQTVCPLCRSPWVAS
ncbi:putative zinc finger protein [Trypanosoma grayi]|uniref:putative zinc finger protein n=1 Tax=Trypanosoma grayi TaxID=71804 RepID=UPI0004F4017C|nr:putative zinc finger protein [Trypanosoma grayi]KEG14341.1 putative zinc finger protein [Trypanosoma grayi]